MQIPKKKKKKKKAAQTQGHLEQTIESHSEIKEDFVTAIWPQHNP